MAEYTLDLITERIRSLDETISRTSALLDSMVPRTETPIYDQFTMDEGFECEELMSDVSDDETIPYLNDFDDGEIDEFADDETVVPEWQDPFWTPPFVREPPTTFTLYRPSYFDHDDLL
jgi:hypothetical protein